MGKMIRKNAVPKVALEMPVECLSGDAGRPGRRATYLLTEKGIDLAPVLTEMVLWAAAREKTGNQALVRQMREDKEKFLTGVRQRRAGRPSTNAWLQKALEHGARKDPQ